ncbi:cytochrome c1 [Alphaproteobacteria bacterium GH1-50]|uniref:Cytochrome c1 n=1 Tax=Kangsaoukella pontilimi TaxID=2691042 RepID=A0A7C9ME50_9RHOB|nr:cytochrome c1 [Kangsaoukella pontilimi]MXQ08132.1 cytochrome c1 [Kangsaoukella pontilimi]
MIRKIALSALTAFGLSAGGAFAAGEAGHITDYDFSFEGPFGTYDQMQLQRGLQVYTEICSACHGLQYVSFRALGYEGGPDLPDDQVRAYAEFYEVFDEELDDFRPATPTDYFPQSSLENAPDLSLMAKARAGFHGPYGLGLNQLFKGMGGPEYIASLLTGYTGEEKEEAGAVLYENEAYPGTYLAMGQPLWGDDVLYEDGTEATIEQQAKDVAAFLMWTAEPQLNARKESGFIAVLFLTVLSVLLYLTNKRIWAPIKKGKAGTTPAE